MSETVEINGWLSDFKRNRYISTHKTLVTKHEITMKTLFSDIEQTAKDHREYLVQRYASMSSGEYTDVGDFHEQINEETYEFYESERLMQYNFHMSLLAMMYQIFEQQLRGFIYEELNHDLSPVRTTEEFHEFGTNMNWIKEAFKYVDYDLEKTMFWDSITLLSDLINTYKHGDGRSAKRLYKKKPEIFLTGYDGKQRLMDQELTTNSEIVLDIEQLDFKSFADAIIGFWNEFPEHVSGIHTLPS